MFTRPSPFNIKTSSCKRCTMKLLQILLPIRKVLPLCIYEYIYSLVGLLFYHFLCFFLKNASLSSSVPTHARDPYVPIGSGALIMVPVTRNCSIVQDMAFACWYLPCRQGECGEERIFLGLLFKSVCILVKSSSTECPSAYI